MKKIFLLASLSFGLIVNAQVIDRNDIIIQAGGGLGIYHYQFTDVTNGSVNERDTSGAWSFPIDVEYGVTRWFGAGLAFTFNNYIEGDSAQNEKARGIDVGLTANFHVPWNLEKFDLSGHMGYAYSNFKYEVNDANGGVAKAGGNVLFFGINPRLYFRADGHLGISGWYRYSMYKYPNGTITDNAGNKSEFKIDGPANSFGLGLIFKL